jgi:membrane protease YdiL (CAAX protease family)
MAVGCIHGLAAYRRLWSLVVAAARWDLGQHRLDTCRRLLSDGARKTGEEDTLSIGGSGEVSVDQRRSRFGRLIERNDGRDFPFYDGRPVEIEWWTWLVMIVAAAAGFAALVLNPFTGQWGLLIGRVLFAAIPLGTFIALSKGYWRSIFQPLRGRDFVNMLVFWLLNLGVSALVALIVSGADVGHLTANSATDDVAAQGAGAIAAFYIGTFVQLFGEEIFTILPFLAVMYFLYSKGRLSRKAALVVAWIGTAIWFGAAHLPTYDWNVLQALVVIGSARIILSLAFIRTKNIMVSFGAHLLNDWVTFTVALVVASSR